MTPPLPLGPDPPPGVPACGALAHSQSHSSSPVALTLDAPDNAGVDGWGAPKRSASSASGGGALATGRPPSGVHVAAASGMIGADGSVGGGGSGSVGAGGVSAARPPPAPILDIAVLSEAYGAALARSVDAARLGLNMKAVAAGMAGAALDGTDFPMPLPEYERQMAAVQAAAVSAGAAAALAEADRFFAATAADPEVEEVVPGAVLVERGEAGDGGAGVGGLLSGAWGGGGAVRGGGSDNGRESSGGGSDGRPPRRRTVAPGATVALVVQGRLLDGTYFYASPVSDAAGGWSSPLPAASPSASWAAGGGVGGAGGVAGAGTPDPLVMDLTEAPPAFGAGLVGMAEGDERTLYVHPRGDAGMRGLFGVGLPPNGLLVFDVVCVSADVADDGEWGGA
ncbi:hypothetical protein MMPV_009817 [Pyropia vietnamensis]